MGESFMQGTYNEVGSREATKANTTGEDLRVGPHHIPNPPGQDGTGHQDQERRERGEHFVKTLGQRAPSSQD